jgi:DNA-binding transcriptional MerR regulator
MQIDGKKQPVIPDKFYFKIGEVSRITEIPAHVLRFWETEFPRIHPKRTPSGQRLYTKNDVQLILQIKELLYQKKFTIQGARQRLESKQSKSPAATASVLDDIRAELKNIRDLLA